MYSNNKRMLNLIIRKNANIFFSLFHFSKNHNRADVVETIEKIFFFGIIMTFFLRLEKMTLACFFLVRLKCLEKMYGIELSICK